jgi:hypothetical protein
MADRYDLLTAREKDGRSYFTKIGVMFPNRSGEGFTCFFEALPIPGPDGCKVIVKLADQNGGQRRAPQPASADLDDDIPGF